MLKMSELNLLMECLSTEGEAEDGGVKYIFMDENTVYRFENNRMKKISKALITKARKQINTQNTINQLQQQNVNETLDTPKPSKSRKTKKQSPPSEAELRRVIQPTADDEYDYDEDDDETTPEPPKQRKSKAVKPPKRSQIISRSSATLDPYTSSIDLNEYYNNKNRMEFMNLEITRLNNKVDKLKQYKAIVNKLTGNEFDMDVPQQHAQSIPQQQFQQQQQQTHNDSLFLY